MTVSARRDRIVDLAVVAAGRQDGGLTQDALVWSCGVAAVGCAALWWRRRYPVGVVAFLVPLAAVTELLTVAVLVAVFTVAVYRRWSAALAAAGLQMLANVPYSIARPDPELTLPVTLAVEFALLAVTVALGMSVRIRRETLVALRDRAARAADEASHNAERLRTMERERLAREMHDVLAQRIALLSLHAGVLEIRPDLSSEDVAQSVRTIRVNAHQALDDLRQILGVLRGGGEVDDLRPQHELAEIDALVAECRAAGVPVDLDNRLADSVKPSLVSRVAYRIVHEGLTNARKHAPGAGVRVQLDHTPAGELHIWLRNPLAGPGRGATPGTRSGLVGLAERVDLTGGRLDYGIRHDADGTLAFHLEAWLPWPT